jgi:DNA polymerase III alpha subunit
LHPESAPGWQDQARRLAARFGERLHLLLRPHYDGRDAARFDRLSGIAARLGLPTVAAACPLMHRAHRRRLADVLSAVRLGVTVDRLGRHALPNAEGRLRPEAEMRRLFSGHAGAVDRAVALAARLTFSLDALRHDYPSEAEGGESATARLRRLAEAGLDWRYPQGAPARVRAMMEHELALIAKLRYEPYFLTVNDVVGFARSRGILCQGRGSAANSVVCYCLGVTSVSPEIGTMVFERFVSEARDEPPDIDVDFEHERREEVIQWIYERYGRHRAGLCATVIHYRAKRAIREVGRAMGLSEDMLSAMSSQIWGAGGSRRPDAARLAEIGLDPRDRRLALTLDLVDQIIGFPRHLSQHVGGFVIAEGRLDELVPIENAAMEDRTVICWDKDDIDTLGILKVDVLALGMLSCIRKAFDLLADHHGTRYTLATLPPEEPRVYAMLGRADSLGVFQVESRAQMNFLPRMRPRCFYDLVIQVAIIRPGPIQGDMVHPYIRRRCAFPRTRWAGCWARRWACRSFRNRRCRSPSSARGSRPKRPTACAARSRPSRSTAMSARCARASSGGCAKTATTWTLPSVASARSRASAATASPRATPRALPCWSMPAPGSSATTRASLPVRCSIPSRWAFTPPRRSCATRANMV